MHHNHFGRFSMAPYFLLFFLAFGVTTCQKSDFENLELADREAEFAFPVFSTFIRLEDLLYKVLNDTLSGDTLLVNPDRTMTLYYSGDVAEKPASDIFDDLAVGFFPMNDSVVNNPLGGPAGVTIRQADLNAGTMGFLVYNTVGETLNGYFEVSHMKKNGEVFKIPFTLPPGTNANVLGPVEVKGHNLISYNNTITFKYFAYKPNGERVVLPPKTNGEPAVIAGFLGLKFSYLEGYWGYEAYPLTRDIIEIDINQTDLDGNVKVENPRVRMRIANSWGFPTRGVVKYLSFIGQNGEELELKSNVFKTDATNTNYVDFNYPSYAAGEVGQTKYTDIYLDETNSNIAEIFNAQPTRLIYEVEGVSNALKDPNIIGFLTDSSNISLNMRVELLLEGSAKNFGAEQTLDLNFGEFADIDTAKIREVEFKLVTENTIPLAADMQIYFQDEAGVNIDSLFTGGPRFIMVSGDLNAQGRVDTPKRTETFIKMPTSRFSKIRNAKTALLQTAFTSAQDGAVPVKLIADYGVTVKMGMKAVLQN